MELNLSQAYADYLLKKPSPEATELYKRINDAIRGGFAPFLMTSFGVDISLAEDLDFFESYYVLTVEVQRLGYSFKTAISRNALTDPEFHDTFYKLGEEIKHQIRYRAGLETPEHIELGEN